MADSRSLTVRFIGDTRSLESALGKAQSRTAAFGQTMKRTGAALTRSVTLPLVVAGAAAVKTAVDFDSSMEKIQGLVGASTKQMETYRKSVLALAPAVAKGPEGTRRCPLLRHVVGVQGREGARHPHPVGEGFDGWPRRYADDR